jgi:hypothetical protein
MIDRDEGPVEGLAGIRRLRARALRHARSRDLTRARTPNHVPHLSREPATPIIRVVLSSLSVQTQTCLLRTFLATRSGWPTPADRPKPSRPAHAGTEYPPSGV